VRAEKARRRLADFIRYGWHVLEPGAALDWNWHIDAIADHVQAGLDDWLAVQKWQQQKRAYDDGQTNDEPGAMPVQRFQNLLINVPPGTAKSRIVSVFTPAWMWLKYPEWRAIYLSANPRVALRDSVFCRDVLESEWYQSWFAPEWELRDDQNSKSLYWNTAGGSRAAFGILSKITGDRGDALFVDDPHDAEEVKSDTLCEAVTERWKDAIANRVNDLRTSLRFGIMQRLRDKDWSGCVLKEGTWEHLCLEMEFEPERRQAGHRAFIPPITAIGWSDPRGEAGELLFDKRFPREVLDAERKRLGDYGYAGQHQQRPAPKEGGFFKPDKLTILPTAPAGLRAVRAWDKAATEGGGDYTAGVLLATDGEGRFYVLDVVRGQWGVDTRDARIRQTAALDGKKIPIRGPQDPGQAGVHKAQAFTRMLAGYSVKTERVTGDKETRAEPFSGQVNAGNVWLIEGDWNKEFIEELRLFPNGSHDDQVDAAADAFNELHTRRKARVF
jgi:predicted phage terminase large subunit-like protein